MDIQKQLDHLLSQPSENEVLEFKKAEISYDFNKLGEYFSALANEANLKGRNSAWLILGVQDNKKIIGTKFKDNGTDLQKLKLDVANHTTNRITFIEIYETQKEDKRVILFKIPAALKGMPVAWKGHYYARDNESLVPLSLEKLERIRAQSTYEDWSVGVCEGATIDDLSFEAIEKARMLYSKKHPEKADEMKDWDTATFLNKAKVTKNGKITRTAILLLGKPESEHFIEPATAKISWILKDKDNIEKDYQHFTCPLITSVDAVFSKIRNLKYRYYSDITLFPEEVEQYTPETIREAINNCIAHQDYTLAGKINIVENETGTLVFSNLGSFIPETVENVILVDAPSECYRNRFLADAMINLNMIDTIGSGIKKMFIAQKKKFFPLPEYDLSKNKVKLTITGKVLDINYARKLAQIPDLDLDTIILLDKVQKRKKLNTTEAKSLKQRHLIEGRAPNFYIAEYVAQKTGEKAEYIRNRGFNDTYYKDLILLYLEKSPGASRQDINKAIVPKLPDVLNEEQKNNKVSNLLLALSQQGKIRNKGNNRVPKWGKNE